MNTFTVDGVIGGVSISGKRTNSPDGEIKVIDTLTAGQSGTLSTRTDDDTGVITLGEGHGLTTETVSVAWSTGSRSLLSINSYDSTTITVDGGGGDALPTEGSTVIVGVAQSSDVDFSGTLLEGIGIKADYRAILDFLDAGGSSLLKIDIPSEGFFIWYSTLSTNPLTGNTIASLKASAGTANDAALEVGIEYSA